MNSTTLCCCCLLLLRQHKRLLILQSVLCGALAPWVESRENISLCSLCQTKTHFSHRKLLRGGGGSRLICQLFAGHHRGGRRRGRAHAIYLRADRRLSNCGEGAGPQGSKARSVLAVRKGRQPLALWRQVQFTFLTYECAIHGPFDIMMDA